MALHHNPRIVTSGLVLALDAADINSYQSGSTSWSDLSGNGNTVTLVNGPTLDSSYNGSIAFDATNDSGNTPSVSAFDVSGGNFTISTFFYLDITAQTSDTYYTILSLDPNLNGLGTFYIRIWRSGLYPGALFTRINNIELLSTHGNSSYSSYTTGEYYNAVDRWTNVVFTENNGTSSYYINGEFYISATTPSIPLGNNRMNLGNAGGNGMNGKLGNVQMYNRALTADEVLQNYNATKTRFGL